MNPYVGYGKVIEEADRLIGRTDEVEMIVNAVRGGANCSITGLRRVGKSSVAMAVASRLKNVAPDVCCEMIDLSTLDNEIDVYRELIDVLGGNPDDVNSDDAYQAYRILKRYLKNRKSQEGVSVVIVDEFDSICKSNFENAVMVINRFRELTQQRKYGLCLVLISRRSLLRIQEEVSSNRESENVSNLAQTCQSCPLTPLGVEGSRKIIARSGFDWSDDAVARIYELCGGHPYLTEELLYYVCEKRGKSVSGKVEVEWVDDAMHNTSCEQDFLTYFQTIRDFSTKSGCWQYLCERLSGIEQKEPELLKEALLKGYGLLKVGGSSICGLSDMFDDFVMRSIPTDVELFRRIGEVERLLRCLIKKEFVRRYTNNWTVECRQDQFYEVLFGDLEVVRKKERRYFRLSNSSDILEYAYPGNLKDIILHEWPSFQRMFGDKKNTFKTNMDMICAVRQPLAHNRRCDLIPIEAQHSAASACEQIIGQINSEQERQTQGN